MDGHDKLPDDGRNRTQGRKDDTPEPRAEGGEAAPERFPSVKKDDSVEPAAEDRSFEGEAANPQPRRGSADAERDPSVDHAGLGADDDAPDAR